MIQLILRLHLAEYICYAVSVGLSFGHLGAQYISVHPLLYIDTVRMVH